MKRKLHKSLATILILFSLLIANGQILALVDIDYLSKSDLSFRKIRGENVLFNRDLYREQFNYFKYKPVEGIFEEMEKLINMGMREKYKKQMIDQAKKFVGDTRSKSFEEIRGKIYEYLKDKKAVIWSSLQSFWDEEAKVGKRIAYKVKSNFEKKFPFKDEKKLKNLLKIFVSSDFDLSNEDGFLDWQKLDAWIDKMKGKLLSEEFQEDYKSFTSRIEEVMKDDGTIVIMPETVQGLTLDMYIFNKLFEIYPDSNAKVKFVVKNLTNIVGNPYRVENFPTYNDFLSISEKLGKNENIESLRVGVFAPGMHLDELSGKATQAIKDADLLVIKGGKNAVTTQFIKKEHFLVGVAEDIQTQHFTGLYNETLPAYVAYVPQEVGAAFQYDIQRATVHSLSDFVQIDLEEREELENNEELRQDIFDSQAGAVLWLAPEVLGKTSDAKDIFKQISENIKEAFRKNETLTLKEAIEEYIDDELSNKPVFIPALFELNKYFNGEKLKEGLLAGGAYERFAFRWEEGKVPKRLNEEAVEGYSAKLTDDERRVIGSMILLPFNNIKNLTGYLASSYGKNKILPESVIPKNNKGIVINGAYFLTARLINQYNDRILQAERDEIKGGIPISKNVFNDFEGMFLGYLKDGNTIYPPLYNKGGIGITENGLEFFRQEITNDFIFNIENETIEGYEVNKLDALEDSENTVVFTPFLEKKERSFLEKRGRLLSSKEDLLILNKSEVDKRYQLICAGNKVIGVTYSTDTVIPPFGYVISLTEEKFKNFKEALSLKEGDLSKLKSENKLVFDKPKIMQISNPKWNKYSQIFGGVTLLSGADGTEGTNWQEILEDAENIDKLSKLSSDVMKDEGAILYSTKQTQETDFSKVEETGPRQVIGIVSDGTNKYFAIFTFSGRSNKIYGNGVNFPELYSIIARQIDNLEGNYTLKGLINLDGGSSVSTSYFEDGKLYTINIPVAGPDSKTNQVRAVNSAIVIKWD